MTSFIEVCGCIYDDASGKFWEPQDIGFSFKHYHEDDLSFELKECTHGAIAPTNHTGARFQLYNEPNDGSGDGSSHRRSHGHGHGRHGDRRGRDGRQRDRKAHNQSRGSEARSARN